MIGAARTVCLPRMTLPLPILPVSHASEALDACLAALDRNTPPGTECWLLDDASEDPRLPVLLQAWQARSRLRVEILRQPAALGLAASLQVALVRAGNRDVALLAPEAQPAGDWLQRLAACAASDPRIAMAQPWTSCAELSAFPRVGEDNPLPEDPDRFAAASASAGAPEYPDLPTLGRFCLYLRTGAVLRLGGLDAEHFPQAGWEADLAQRLRGMGLRTVLCDDAYVPALPGTGMPMEAVHRLLARWPGHHEQVAAWLLSDPLRPLRLRLQERLQRQAHPAGQKDLFG